MEMEITKKTKRDEWMREENKEERETERENKWKAEAGRAARRGDETGKIDKSKRRDERPRRGSTKQNEETDKVFL